METTKNKKGIAFKPFVIKSFFAVVHKKEYPQHKRLILRESPKHAIMSWENASNKKIDDEWMVIKLSVSIKAKNV